LTSRTISMATFAIWITLVWTSALILSRSVCTDMVGRC
jgi:hypothetical protein